MPKYRVHLPVTGDMSPISYVVSDKPTETAAKEALWHYNKSRDHDGLRPLERLPIGTRWERIHEA